MIDDDGGDIGGGGELPFARTYDFFKYMTGISLVSIGGVLAFIDGDAVRIDPRLAIVIIVFLVLAGVASLLMAASLAGLEVRSVAPRTMVRRVKIGSFVAVFFLSIGLGAFIQTFVAAIVK